MRFFPLPSCWSASATIRLRLATVFLLSLTLVAPCWAQDRAKQWVDNTGKHKVEAEFVRLDGNQVVLKRLDGKEIKIPFDRLSPESVVQAQRMGSGGKNASPPSNGAYSSGSGSGSSGGGASSYTRFPDDLEGKAFVDLVYGELNEGRTIVLWDALPPAMQKDAESLVVAFAKRLDSRTFDMLRKTRNNVVDILKKQQRFVLNSSVIGIPSDQAAVVEASYPSAVALFESVLAKELFDGKRLQKGDMRGLLEPYFQNINTAGEKLVATLPEDHPMRLEYQKAKRFGVAAGDYTVTQDSSTQVSVVMENPNAMPEIGKTTMQLTLVDGRWLPKDMVANWDSGVQQAKLLTAMMKPEDIHSGVTSALLVLNAPLNNLKNAKTQEEFDRTLKELETIFQGIAGGAMAGGPGGFAPPGGGPPPGGFRGVPPGQPTPPPAGTGNSGTGSASIDQ
jgi:hypothetical protein